MKAVPLFLVVGACAKPWTTASVVVVPYPVMVGPVLHVGDSTPAETGVPVMCAGLLYETRSTSSYGYVQTSAGLVQGVTTTSSEFSGGRLQLGASVANGLGLHVSRHPDAVDLIRVEKLEVSHFQSGGFEKEQVRTVHAILHGVVMAPLEEQP